MNLIEYKNKDRRLNNEVLGQILKPVGQQLDSQICTNLRSRIGSHLLFMLREMTDTQIKWEIYARLRHETYKE